MLLFSLSYAVELFKTALLYFIMYFFDYINDEFFKRSKCFSHIARAKSKGFFSAELCNDGILNIKSPLFTELHKNEIE